jgi:hypothetical protein
MPTTLQMTASAPRAVSGAESMTTATPRMPLWVPLLLSLPALIPLLWTVYHAWSQGLVPTTFVQYDEPAYVANARQHFANGFQWTYGNPYASYGTPAIYFQPQFFLLGMLQWAGVSPDLAWFLFGLGAMAFAALAAGRLYEEWVGWSSTAHKIGFVCFFWGGGVMGLGGLVFGLISHSNLTRALFSFDPAEGWWMLNFGRNLVYPQEAYYHGLFLTAIVLLLRRRFGWALATAALLSISHPFTGLSFALILAAYSALELALKSGAASRRLLLGSCALAIAHVGYYMVFLNRFADHRSLQQQYSLDWPYAFWTLVPALYIVGVLAFGRLTRWKNLAPLLAQPRMRLCLVWLAVILGLTQHDLVMKPMQPIHFAHGYDWMALFLLATPALLPLIEKLLAVRTMVWRVAALAVFLAVFVSDNLLWLASFHDRAVQWHAVMLTPDEDAVLRWLSRHPDPAAYVASAEPWINYLTPTYANMRAWRGHNFNTPQAEQRKQQVEAVFTDGVLLAASGPVYYIPERRSNWTPPPGARQLYYNASYVIWRFDPAELTAEITPLVDRTHPGTVSVK